MIRIVLHLGHRLSNRVRDFHKASTNAAVLVVACRAGGTLISQLYRAIPAGCCEVHARALQACLQVADATEA